VNVVQFPRAVLAQVRRAYGEELQRIDRLEYEGKPARSNKHIIRRYYEALRGGRPFFD
jgi:hypothetical protein